MYVDYIRFGIILLIQLIVPKTFFEPGLRGFKIIFGRRKKFVKINEPITISSHLHLRRHPKIMHSPGVPTCLFIRKSIVQHKRLFHSLSEEFSIPVKILHTLFFGYVCRLNDRSALDILFEIFCQFPDPFFIFGFISVHIHGTKLLQIHVLFRKQVNCKKVHECTVLHVRIKGVSG